MRVEERILPWGGAGVRLTGALVWRLQLSMEKWHFPVLRSKRKSP